MKGQHRPTFAEMVASLETAPRSTAPRIATPGLHGTTVVDPNGHWFEEVELEIDDTVAHQLISAGVKVAVDDCGCGGGCGVEWPSSERLRVLAAQGPIRRRRKDSAVFALYRSPHTDEQLLLVSQPLEWIRPAID